MTRLQIAIDRLYSLMREDRKRLSKNTSLAPQNTTQIKDPNFYILPFLIIGVVAFAVYSINTNPYFEFLRPYLPGNITIGNGELFTETSHTTSPVFASFFEAKVKAVPPAVLEYAITVTSICLATAIAILFLTLTLYLFSANEGRSQKAGTIVKTMVKFLVGSLAILIGALALKLRSST